MIDPEVGSVGAVVATDFQCSDGQRFVVKVTDRLTLDRKYWISALQYKGKTYPGLMWNQASSAIFNPSRGLKSLLILRSQDLRRASGYRGF